jgi:hypothetical protein
MVDATIRSINLTDRTVVLETRDGRERSVHFPLNAHIEVTEPCSGGTQGGRLEDLGVGYLVQVDLHEHGSEAPCHCVNLISIS